MLASESSEADILKLEKLIGLQERSWTSRSTKLPTHLRVAFVQWDVDETYQHPIFDVCELANNHAHQSLRETVESSECLFLSQLARSSAGTTF